MQEPTQHHRRGIEDLITLERRKNVPLDMDVLVVTLLSFYIGNSIKSGPGRGMKWCPIGRKWGSTIYGLTNKRRPSLTDERDSERNTFQCSDH